MSEWISPVDERARELHEVAPALASLAGKRISLMSISKPKSGEFLDELERILVEEYDAVVRRTHKPTFAAPAPDRVIADVVADSDAVIEALAD